MKRKELKKYVKNLQDSRYLRQNLHEEILSDFINAVKKDKDELSMAYVTAFKVYNDFRKYNLSMESISKLLSCLPVANEYNDATLQIETYNMLGICALFFVDEISALDYYEKAYSIAKRHGYIGFLGILANNIGDIYMRMEEYDTALKYFRDCSEYFLSDKKVREGDISPSRKNERFNLSLINMVEIYCKIGDYEEAFRVLTCIEASQENQAALYYYTSFLVIKLTVYSHTGRKEGIEEIISSVLSAAHNNVELSTTFDDYITLGEYLLDNARYSEARELIDALSDSVSEIDSAQKWCDFLKLQIRLEKAAFSGTDITALYEKFFSYSEKLEQSLKSQRVTALKNKYKLEAEVHKRNLIEERNRKLKIMAQHDALTGLYNRYALSEIGEKWFAEAKQKSEKFTLMVLDIDYFKEYNDTYGHLQGDEILKTVSSVLLESTTGRELVVRYGGDEFFVLSRGRHNDEVVHLATEISRRLKERNVAHSASKVVGRVTVTVGAINSRPTRDENLFDFIHKADNALYKIKNNTRNAFGFYLSKNNEILYDTYTFD